MRFKDINYSHCTTHYCKFDELSFRIVTDTCTCSSETKCNLTVCGGVGKEENYNTRFAYLLLVFCVIAEQK